MPEPMSILVVGHRQWAVETAIEELEAAGHRALRCREPDEPAFPCNAFIPGRTCPMHAGVDVVVAERSGALPRVSTGELGALCGTSHGLPLVVAGASGSHPFDRVPVRVTSPERESLVEACETVVGGRGRPATATVVGRG